MVSDGLPQRASVVIVGGGVMGVSAAYHLACGGQTDVLLLERSDLLGQGATGKCAGGIRHQFGTEINIRLSIESIRMLERFETEPGQAIGLHQCGYLFVLTRAEDIAAFERNVALQRELGVMTEWLTPEEVRRRLPLLRTEDVQGGTFYGRDGLCDPSSVVLGYATGARHMGATLLTRIEVTGVRLQAERVTAVVTTEGDVQCDSFINAAGPFAADIGQMLGLELPITPLRRQMLVTTPLPQVPADFPFVIDFATGLYFHREGPGILTGMANQGEPASTDERVDLEWEAYQLGMAVRRMPLLEQAGMAHHWAGLYEMTPDAHPLIGRLEPLTNAYVVAGFSGHGFMHGPIAGKLLAEIMLNGRPRTIADISALSPNRFGMAPAVREYNVI